MAFVFLHVPLTARGQAGFSFDHDQNHRAYVPQSPPAPYIFDPPANPNIPAGPFHLFHQQAHNDFNSKFNIPTSQNIKENNLSIARNLTWWTWVNYWEHSIANEKLT